jgi:hypothetical protein
MMTITAIVRNGRIEVNEPLDLPDGTILQIPVPGDEEKVDRESMSQEEILRVLDAMDHMQPLQMSDAELAAWEADRQARKESEKARFIESAKKLHGMWE